MAELPREIMNFYRRDLHASETIISSDHPDVKEPTQSSEVDIPTSEMTKHRLFRLMGRSAQSQAFENMEE